MYICTSPLSINVANMKKIELGENIWVGWNYYLSPRENTNWRDGQTDPWPYQRCCMYPVLRRSKPLLTDHTRRELNVLTM
jgi:hypothetical protein